MWSDKQLTVKDLKAILEKLPDHYTITYDGGCGIIFDDEYKAWIDPVDAYGNPTLILND